MTHATTSNAPVDLTPAVMFLKEWLEACRKNSIEDIRPLLERLPEESHVQLIKYGSTVCVEHGSDRWLQYFINHYPHVDFSDALVKAAGCGQVRCLNLLLAVCTTQTQRDQAFCRAIVSNQVNAFEILYPLCDAQHIKREHFSICNPLLDERIEQERLNSVLKTATDAYGQHTSKPKI